MHLPNPEYCLLALLSLASTVTLPSRPPCHGLPPWNPRSAETCHIRLALSMTCRQLYSANTRQAASSPYCSQVNFIKRCTRSRSLMWNPLHDAWSAFTVSSIPRGRRERGFAPSSGACEKLHQACPYHLMLVHLYSPLPATRVQATASAPAKRGAVPEPCAPHCSDIDNATNPPLHHPCPTSSCTPHFATPAPCTTTIVVPSPGHSEIPQLPLDSYEGQLQLACIILPARLHARTATAARPSH